MGDANPFRTLRDYSRPSHERYRNTIELPEGNNVDLIQQLKDFLKLVVSLDLDDANRERTHLTAKLRNDIMMFQQHQGESLSEAWTCFKDLLQKVTHHGINLWLQVQIFYNHANLITRRTIDQSADGKLRDRNTKEYWALLEDLALHDTKSWNDPRNFAKPVKVKEGFQPERLARVAWAVDKNGLPRIKGTLISSGISRIIKSTGKMNLPILTSMFLAIPFGYFTVPSANSIVNLVNPNRTYEQGNTGKRIWKSTSSTEANSRDKVKSISTAIEADSYPICHTGSSQYAVSTGQNSSFNVTPLLTYLNLGLGELAHTKLTIELEDGTVKYPKGIAKNMLVRIGKFIFPVDFLILDMPEDIKVPLILGIPFLSMAHAKIDVYKRKITLRVRKERIIFTSVKPASSLIKRVYMLSLRERMEVNLEARLMGETLVLNRSLDPFFEDYIELSDLNEPIKLRRNLGDDLMSTIEEGKVIKEFRTRDDKLDDGIDDHPSYCIYDKKIHIDCTHNLMSEGMITIYNGNAYVTYQMVRTHLRFKYHTNEQCNKIPPLLKRSFDSLNFKAIDLSLVRQSPRMLVNKFPNELKESPNAHLVKDMVSDNEDCSAESLVVAYTYYCQMKVNAAKHKLTTAGMVTAVRTYAKIKTVNEDLRLQALVDGKKVIVNKASIRRDLRLDDAKGTACLSNAAIFKELERIGAMAFAIICLANNQNLTFPSTFLIIWKHKSKRKQRKETEVPHTESKTKEHIPTPTNDPLPSGEDRLQLNELMEICTKLSDRVLSLEQIKTNQAAKIEKLKKRVKKLEGKKKKRTHGLKQMYKGRIVEIDADEDLSLINKTAQDQERMNYQDMFGVNNLDGNEVVVDVSAGEKEEQSGKVAKKEVSTTDPVTTAGEVVTTTDVEVNAALTTTTTYDELTLARTLIKIKTAKPKALTAATTTVTLAKDKGRGIMVKIEKPLKKKDQIALDEEVVRKLKAYMKAKMEEEERIEREKDEANIALSSLNLEESILLPKKLKRSETSHLQSSKRAGDEIEQESAKRQRLEKEDDTAELKRCMGIVPEDDDEVTIEATPLSSKSPTIVDYKIYKEGKKSYFKIIRANGN
nr:zinc finger, CCHC-type [Tanacetum cinerariifolium]